MRFVFSIIAALAAAIALGPAPVRAAVLIEVDKSAQQLTVFVDGQQRYSWRVSTGRPGYDTPSGRFTAFRMEADHFSKEWDDAPMPHSIFFTKIGHAIHGTEYERYLGTPASHGCVRLSRANAAILFDLVKRDGLLTTKVVLTGQTPGYAPGVAQRGLPTGGFAPATTGYGQFNESSNNAVFVAPAYGGTDQAPTLVRPPRR